MDQILTLKSGLGPRQQFRMRKSRGERINIIIKKTSQRMPKLLKMERPKLDVADCFILYDINFSLNNSSNAVFGDSGHVYFLLIDMGSILL